MAKPSKAIRLTETEFRNNEGLRNELLSYLESIAFTQALNILTKRRQFTEAAMEATSMPAPEIVSVRFHSQRVGMEGFVNDLYELCNPPTPVRQEQEADFGANQE